MERLSHQPPIHHRILLRSVRLKVLKQSLTDVEHKSKELVGDDEYTRTESTILEYIALATTSPEIELKMEYEETELITTTYDWSSSFAKKQRTDETIKLKE
jgi:hypothetical protein